MMKNNDETFNINEREEIVESGELDYSDSKALGIADIPIPESSFDEVSLKNSVTDVLNKYTEKVAKVKDEKEESLFSNVKESDNFKKLKLSKELADKEQVVKETEFNLEKSLKIFVFDLDDLTQKTECEDVLTKAIQDTDYLEVAKETNFKSLSKTKEYYILEKKELNFSTKTGSYAMYVSIITIKVNK
jgi:hypothetical protein